MLQPLPKGQKREWADWEYLYPPLMSLGFILYGVFYYFRPNHSMSEWARIEALKRMEQEQ